MSARAGAPRRPGGSPLGASVVGSGVNFSVFSRSATRVDLLLFDDVGDSYRVAPHSVAVLIAPGVA